MLIAELDGQVAGTVGITGHRFQLPDSLRLFALDVGPTFRGQGVGTTLIKAVEEQARHQGLKGVNLEVSVENADAIRLYERLGYRRLGEPVVDHEELLWIMVKTFGVQQTA